MCSGEIRGPNFFIEPGVNGCGVYIDGFNHSMDRYDCHNIDNKDQAIALYVSLNVHMKNTITYLGMLESDAERSPDANKEKKLEFTTCINFLGKGAAPEIIRDGKRVEFPRRRS